MMQLKILHPSNLILSDISPSSYDYTVKGEIELGSGGGDLVSGESLTLRANTSIILENGYEAKLGSELVLVISDCMNGAGSFDPLTNPGGTEHSSPKSFPRPILYPIENE